MQKLTENPSSNEYYILPANGDCNFNELGLNIFFGILGGETTKDHKTSEDLISFLAVSSFFKYHELCQYSETMIIESINETVSTI